MKVHPKVQVTTATFRIEDGPKVDVLGIVGAYFHATEVQVVANSTAEQVHIIVKGLDPHGVPQSNYYSPKNNLDKLPDWASNIVTESL